MKKETKRKLFSCIFLIALWILPCFGFEIYPKTYVYFAAFILSVAIIYFLKKEWLSFMLTAVIATATSIHNYEYLFIVFPVVLLIYAHHSISFTEEKKAESFNTANNCTTLSFLFMIGEIFYSVVQYDKIEAHRIANVYIALETVSLFLIIFAFLMIQSRKKENHRIIPKKKADKYVMLYIISLFGLAVSLLAFHSLNGYGTQSIRTEYIFWFGYVLTMAINRDPYIEITISRLKHCIGASEESNK